MTTPHIIIAVASVVGLAAIAVIAWVVRSLVADYRAERGADAAARAAGQRTADRLCRGETDADLAALAEATQPLDVVDRPHMTVPQFAELNRQFLEIVRANWPDQT